MLKHKIQFYNEKKNKTDYSQNVIYWGTYCLFVMGVQPFRPTFYQWQKYHITCVRANIQWEPFEQAQAVYDKIQCSTSLEWWHYKELYYII